MPHPRFDPIPPGPTLVRAVPVTGDPGVKAISRTGIVG